MRHAAVSYSPPMHYRRYITLTALSLSISARYTPYGLLCVERLKYQFLSNKGSVLNFATFIFEFAIPATAKFSAGVTVAMRNF